VGGTVDDGDTVNAGETVNDGETICGKILSHRGELVELIDDIVELARKILEAHVD
jgi:hypothetical protein